MYLQPASKVPRLEMWGLHFSLVDKFARSGETSKVVDQILAAFESVGFDIEGARSSKIVIKKWGFPHLGAFSAWLTLRDVYMALGKPDLAEQAKEFARIAWMLLVGEDTTFVYENPPRA